MTKIQAAVAFVLSNFFKSFLKGEQIMIASAIQRGSSVYVYDERGKNLYTRSGTLIGFTSTTVTIKRGNTNYV